MKNIILLILFLFFLGSIVTAQQISLTCDPCYVKNCQCLVNCNAGKMYVYDSSSCIGTENSIIDFSNYSVVFTPVLSGQYYASIDCSDNNQISSCQPIYVSAYPGQITTTTTTTTETSITSTTIQTTQTVQTAQTHQTTPDVTTTATIQKGGTTSNQTQSFWNVSINTILVIILLFVILVVVVGLLFYLKNATSNNGNN